MIPGQKNDHPSFIRSLRYACQGFGFALKTERNIKIMIALFFLAIMLGIVLRCNAHEWAIILIGSGVVFCAELFNTALESVVDLASPKFNSLAGHAKDLSAAAVWILAAFVGLAGCIIYYSAALRLFLG